VNPGPVATRSTNAARALELPVVDEAAEAVADDVGAAGSDRAPGAGAEADVGAALAQRPDVDEATAADEGVDDG
jgi:hypothetical protein